MTRQTSPTYRSTAKLKVCKETFLPKCCYQMRIGYITCVIYNTPDNLRIALEDNFDHSIFHCENRCGVCHGDNRQCSCNERPPQKRKKISKSTASSQQPADTSHDDLKKKYESLQKDYKRVGQAFQNQQEQNQELTALLEEREKEAEELANLVRNKYRIIKNLERRLLNAKKVMAELRAEVRRRHQPAP